MNSIEQAIPFVCAYLKIKDLINLRCVSRSFFKLVNCFFDGKYSCKLNRFDLVLNEYRLDVKLKADKDQDFWTSRWFSSDSSDSSSSSIANGGNDFKKRRMDHSDIMDFDFTISLNNKNKLQCFKPLMINYLGCCVERLKLVFQPTKNNSKILFDHLTSYARLKQLDLHMLPFSNLFNILKHPNLRVLYINDENIGEDSGLEINCPKLEMLHLDLTRPEFELVHKSQLKRLSGLHFGLQSTLDLSDFRSLETLECNRIKNFQFDQLTKLPKLREFIVKFSTLFNTEKLIQLFDETELMSILNELEIYLTDKKVSNKEDCKKIFNLYRLGINMPSIRTIGDFQN